jgi:hypothetical protein
MACNLDASALGQACASIERNCPWGRARDLKQIQQAGGGARRVERRFPCRGRSRVAGGHRRVIGGGGGLARFCRTAVRIRARRSRQPRWLVVEDQGGSVVCAAGPAGDLWQDGGLASRAEITAAGSRVEVNTRRFAIVMVDVDCRSLIVGLTALNLVAPTVSGA